MVLSISPIQTDSGFVRSPPYTLYENVRNRTACTSQVLFISISTLYETLHNRASQEASIAARATTSQVLDAEGVHVTEAVCSSMNSFISLIIW